MHDYLAKRRGAPTSLHASRIARCVAVAVVPFMTIATFAQTNAPSILFDRDIKPIFEQSCLRCHGAEKPKSGFRLTDAVVRAYVVRSLLIQSVAGLSWSFAN